MGGVYTLLTFCCAEWTSCLGSNGVPKGRPGSAQEHYKKPFSVTTHERRSNNLRFHTFVLLFLLLHCVAYENKKY